MTHTNSVCTSSSHFSMLTVLCWWYQRGHHILLLVPSVFYLFLPYFHLLLGNLAVKTHRSLPAKAELLSGSSQQLCSWGQGLGFPRWKWCDVWVASPPRWPPPHYHGHGHSAKLVITYNFFKNIFIFISGSHMVILNSTGQWTDPFHHISGAR